MVEMDDQNVSVNVKVDATELQDVFNTIGEGFVKQHKMIRKAQAINVALAALLTTNFVLDWVIR